MSTEAKACLMCPTHGICSNCARWNGLSSDPEPCCAFCAAADAGQPAPLELPDVEHDYAGVPTMLDRVVAWLSDRITK